MRIPSFPPPYKPHIWRANGEWHCGYVRTKDLRFSQGRGKTMKEAYLRWAWTA